MNYFSFLLFFNLIVISSECLSQGNWFGAIPREGNSTFSIEVQKDEMKSLCEKVKVSYEFFAIGEGEVSDNDREAARELFGSCCLD